MSRRRRTTSAAQMSTPLAIPEMKVWKPSATAARISSSSDATISASLLFSFSGRWPVKHTRRILSSDSFDIRITTFPKYSLQPERASFKYKYHHNLRYYFHPFALTASPNVVIEYILEVRWFCGHPSKADRIAGATRLVRLQNRRTQYPTSTAVATLRAWSHWKHCARRSALPWHSFLQRAK